MSFRYKSALISLASLVITYAYYFARVASGEVRNPVGLMIGVVIAITIIQIVGHSIIAITSPDRYAPMDERERGLDRRATTVGYYLLIAGSLMAAATVHLGEGKAAMANAILLAIVVAECARQAVYLALHHRAA